MIKLNPAIVDSINDFYSFKISYWESSVEKTRPNSKSPPSVIRDFLLDDTCVAKDRFLTVFYIAEG